ncbi:MAG: UDP-N-acetylmuramoyl-tripeptide-D-alanyl-D-alanine ligase [Parcubacteria group bacterium GW2011_GWD2_43_10]|uniref:UDP-N-acetylmuramoyl-tripeptide--D-alanyl-D-alanine ligase n=3 Tax=Candidatus Vebleniibacteriota TaxID=1817921 RepID=A0A1G2Q6H7_9BACT|nr:MAG: UDP-N-acetylmuramoyl-tripeptide-D-alanyl-D-alanine ligase [Parcubacteria group bacterium GW2011_GWA2_42_80]KKS83924.1 MAG: UDP-N-acetylmuramoyl-tripeptide-D-alanyl-D-alanine ligase [Parcubacteria group bacterium GW2011_GWD2_43_10]KKS93751.1 MAG: UDP-N-acetylmuramoyl-tripeptide-D-alanyl-D-alanine ligase [Parcubacteria group bacterium GW2011_GWE2_43_12]KKT16131.1 MAG: UDP-N-acetylmuramoyl-tripeptide-D-alanyl-D-alanine ligase [Parcubacteria group bacterium GW2011_GWF2_43_38]KKT17850.1 MAG:
MKIILQQVLKILARVFIARYHPRIVGVTGSVGKTGSRLAIAAVLAERWRVGQAQNNFNNEIGLPLAILGEPDSGYRNLLAWLGILIRAIKHLVIKQKDYPEVLVLEYGVDHPGDMNYLLAIARPEVAVITAISATHLEFFGSVEGVAMEKSKLIASLPLQGTAVLNFDFSAVELIKNKTKAKVIGYGEDRSAVVRLIGIDISKLPDSTIQGVSFRLAVGGSTVPVLIRETVGQPVVSMAAAGAAVGQAMGLSVLEITHGLEKFKPPAGRLRLIKGLTGSLILDDTYNSSPQAAAAALDILKVLPLNVGAKRWAVLGDMLELGADSENLHYEIGRRVADSKVDYLVTVGTASENITKGAQAAGLAYDESWHVTDTREAIKLIQQKVNKGDIILVKGSQGVRCERIVKGIMLEPERAGELLVRQSPPWV